MEICSVWKIIEKQCTEIHEHSVWEIIKMRGIQIIITNTFAMPRLTKGS